jgi:hypothetical protein
MLCGVFLLICLPVLDPDLNQVPWIYSREVHILSVVDKTEQGEASNRELRSFPKSSFRFLTVAL